MDDVGDKSLFYAKRFLGATKATQAAIVGKWHDVIEGIEPDITPFMGITKPQKHELEMMVIDHVGTFGHTGKVVKRFWLEFEFQRTDVAKLVKKVDVLSMAYKALSYELANRSPYSLEEFWKYTAKHLEGSPFMDEWHKLAKQRPMRNVSKPTLIRTPKETETFESIRNLVLQRIGKQPTAPSTLTL